MRTQITKLSFTDQSIYVGIDVHKKSWKVTIGTENHEHKSFSMNPSAHELANYLSRNFPGGTYKAVYESGFCGFHHQRKLANLGIDCKVIHAADLPSTSIDRQKKTDTHDSRLLMKYMRAGILKGVHIPDEVLEMDRLLVRQRFAMVKNLAASKLRVKSLLMTQGIDAPDYLSESQINSWGKAYLRWLQELQRTFPLTLGLVLQNHLDVVFFNLDRIKNLNRQLVALSMTDRYRENVELLRGIPGIGLNVAMTLLTELGDIRRFNTLDELCAFIGLMPSTRSSGEKTNTGKLVNRGRSQIKIMLIEASWIAIRKDPALMLRFDEIAKSKPKNKAIIKIAKKLLSRVRHVLINQQPYQTGVIK